jgi:dihydroorotate dehydrogenase
LLQIYTGFIYGGPPLVREIVEGLDINDVRPVRSSETRGD